MQRINLKHTWFSDGKARLVIGLDNSEGGDKEVELEDWLLR